ncbi:MAG: DEAD/DEAH box helicase family protein [Pirellulaceae bacterium]
MNHLSFMDGTLVLEGWQAQAVERVFGTEIWTWDGRANCWRCAAQQYPQVLKLLQEKATGYVDTVPHWQAVKFRAGKLPTLRTEQQQAVDAWLRTRAGVVVMPTGTGKTEVALRIMQHMSCSTLIVAPVRDLMYQWHRRILAGLEVDAGIIGDSLYNVRAISVTTYSSACIHMPKLGNRFKLLIFDECHHLPGRVRSDAARMSIAAYRLGLTATPKPSGHLANTGPSRLDLPLGGSPNLDDLIGPVCYELPLEKVRGRTLADYDVVRIPVHLSDEEQARYDGLADVVRHYMHQRRTEEPTFTWEQLCMESSSDIEARRALQAYRQKQAIEDRASEKLRILEDLLRLHAGSPVIVFVGSNAMARDVSQRFLIPCLLSHCGKKERLDYLDGLRDGIYPALVANQVLDEGVDLPEVKVAVVVGGMASTKQAKQRLGRILRKRADSRAILYEVVCQNTGEAKRSRYRRDSDAYRGTRHRRL